MRSNDGYCAAHAKLYCERCRLAWEKTVDWGLFEYDIKNIYSRAEALEVFKTKRQASRAADKAFVTTLVVRYVTRCYRPQE